MTDMLVDEASPAELALECMRQLAGHLPVALSQLEACLHEELSVTGAAVSALTVTAALTHARVAATQLEAALLRTQQVIGAG